MAAVKENPMQSAALAVVDAPQVGGLSRADNDPFAVTSMSQGLELAKILFNGRLLPKGITSPEAAFTVIMTGHELGLSPMNALRSIWVWNGTPTLSAQIMAGLVQRRKDLCEYFTCIESNERTCTYETKRRGAPKEVRFTWTIEMAARAGLLGKDPWKKTPEAMLRARVQADLARMVYPDIVGGLYDPDELDTPPVSGVMLTTPIIGESVGLPQAANETKDAQVVADTKAEADASNGASEAQVKEYQRLASLLEKAANVSEISPIGDEISRVRSGNGITHEHRNKLSTLWRKRRAELKAAAPKAAESAPAAKEAPASSPRVVPMTDEEREKLREQAEAEEAFARREEEGGQ